MKILCISDQIDPLVYTPSIKERFSDVDLILSAGDLPMEYLGFIVSCLNKPLLFVFGNHNLTELPYYQGRAGGPDLFGPYDEASRHAFGATHIGSRIVREQGLLIMGLGGSIMYNHGPNQFTDRQMLMQMIRQLPHLLFNKLVYGRYLDILVTHAPPLGIHDKSDPCHVGFKSFLWFMRKFRPKYLIHGHIHLYDLNDVRSSTYDQTTVINAYSHYLITTGDAS